MKKKRRDDVARRRTIKRKGPNICDVRSIINQPSIQTDQSPLISEEMGVIDISRCNANFSFDNICNNCFSIIRSLVITLNL